MPEKNCPICKKKFKARKKQKTCSKKCGAKLHKLSTLNQRKEKYIKELEIRHPDINYISGYKPRTHRGTHNFKVLVQCKNTKIRFWVWSNKLRQKAWKCSICNTNSVYLSVFKDDQLKYKHFKATTKKISLITFYPQKCKWCGRIFSTTDSRRIYCSAFCSKKYENHIKQVKKDNRLKLAKRNGKYEDITLAILYKRDHGKCYICGKHLILNDKYNRPDAPTIEHVVPICKGGTHTWDNVRLACRACNNAKGTKLLKEYIEKAS